MIVEGYVTCIHSHPSKAASQIGVPDQTHASPITRASEPQDLPAGLEEIPY
jgi:hypothetical protein